LQKPGSPKQSAKAIRNPATPAKKLRETADRVGAPPLAEAPISRLQPISSKKALKPKKTRKEEISFSVTQAFRKKFKQAAKEAGHKRSDFLQILLLHWEERQQTPPSGASL
jgi:hypothetical protein